jgi:hypothetical protein
MSDNVALVMRSFESYDEALRAAGVEPAKDLAL